MDILQKQTPSGTGYRTKIDKQKTQHINLKKNEQHEPHRKPRDN